MMADAIVLGFRINFQIDFIFSYGEMPVNRQIDIFGNIFFLFWPSSVVRGTPPRIFFFNFFSIGKDSSSIHLFFSENGVRNNLIMKESRRFFTGGGVIMTPFGLARVKHIYSLLQFI